MALGFGFNLQYLLELPLTSGLGVGDARDNKEVISAYGMSLVIKGPFFFGMSCKIYLSHKVKQVTLGT